MIVLVFIISAFVCGQEIDDCGVISSPGSYILNRSITSGDTCINITSDDVVLDLGGFNITSSSTYVDRIFAEGRKNIVIRNGGLVTSVGGGVSTRGMGVYFKNTNDSRIESVRLYGGFYPIMLDSSHNNTIVGVRNYGVVDSIIRLDYSDYNRIFDIRSSYSMNEGWGLFLADSHNNYVRNASLLNFMTSGMRLDSSHNNTFVDVTSTGNLEGPSFEFNFGSTGNLLLNPISDGEGVLENYSIRWSNSNWIAYNNTYGEIILLEPITTHVEGALSFGEGGNIVISNNSAFLNPWQLTPLNKSANITLRNTGIMDAYILRDGAPCTDCVLLASEGDTHTFSVAGWSNYSLMENPYRIVSCQQLQDIREDLAGHFNLTADIDCTGFDFGDGEGFMPIGNNTHPFIGSLDGRGFEIIGLHIARARSEIGLFGYTDSAVITDVGLIDVNITGTINVGALIGYGDGATIVNNSYSTGMITGSYTVGGLIGADDVGIIDSSYSGCTVNRTFTLGEQLYGGLIGSKGGGSVIDSYATGRVSGGAYSGGFAGENYGVINNSFATGDVSGDGEVGGFVGQNRHIIDGSYATGSILNGDTVGGFAGYNDGSIYRSHSIGSVQGGSMTGGFVGYSGGVIAESYASGTVSGSDEVGGFVGLNTGTINRTYASGRVSANDYVGGFAGSNRNGIIEDSYTTGSVNGSQTVGGFVGHNFEANISGSYAIGAVAGSTDVGGFVGLNDMNSTINISYWGMHTSSQASMCGNETRDAIGCDDGYGRTTAQMKTKSTYSDWSIATTTTNMNAGYPFLAWQAGRDDVMWLIYLAPPAPPPSGGSGGGGFGGGGGGGFAPRPQDVPEIARSKIREGYAHQMKKGESVRFSLGERNHTLSIDEITETAATLTVSSTPQTRTLGIGQDWDVDLDDDGSDDIRISILDITDDTAQVFMKTIERVEAESTDQESEQVIIEETEPVPLQETVEPQQMSQEDAEEKSMIWILALFGMVVLGAVVFFMFSLDKK